MEIFTTNSASLTEKGRIFYLFFSRFLKEHKCFYAYQRALLSKSCRPTKMEDFINLCNTWDISIICRSFIWSNTIEGYKFWRSLHKEFRFVSSHVSLK